MKRAVLLLSIGFTIIGSGAHAQCVDPYWRQLAPAQSPPGPYRGLHGMTYDSKRNVTVLYGGANLDEFGGYGFMHDGDDVLGDTWEFDGLTWRQVLTPTQPFTLVSQAMSYDPLTRMVVMYGGVVGTNGYPVSGFSWEYDGNDWHVVNAGLHPPPRSGSIMVYDSARGVHVMFGGYTPDAGTLSETWEYDSRGKTWTLRSTNGPPRRSGFGMAYDSARNQTVLFGGLLSDADIFTDHANDTWVWDGAQGVWTQLFPTHRPVGRAYHGMTFDNVRNVAVVLGGEVIDQVYSNSVTQTNSRESWEWTGTDWQDRTVEYAFPSKVQPNVLVYEIARQQIVLYQLLAGEITEPNNTYAAATGNGLLNYVDWSNFSGLEFGSLFFPFRTLRSAVGCTLGAGIISMQSGNYAEGPLRINKELRLQARNGPVLIH